MTMLDYSMAADQLEREAKTLIIDRSSWIPLSSKVYISIVFPYHFTVFYVLKLLLYLLHKTLRLVDLPVQATFC